MSDSFFTFCAGIACGGAIVGLLCCLAELLLRRRERRRERRVREALMRQQNLEGMAKRYFQDIR